MRKMITTKLFASSLIASLLSMSACSKLFVSYCQRVENGTADKSWIVDSMTSTVPFSKVSYETPQGSSSGVVCITAQGATLENSSGKNFSYEIVDSNDKTLIKKTGTSAAQPINRENQLKLWGGQNATNKNAFESNECFPLKTLNPYVIVKVKRLSSGETDQVKLWNNKAFCLDRKKGNS